MLIACIQHDTQAANLRLFFREHEYLQFSRNQHALQYTVRRHTQSQLVRFMLFLHLSTAVYMTLVKRRLLPPFSWCWLLFFVGSLTVSDGSPSDLQSATPLRHPAAGTVGAKRSYSTDFRCSFSVIFSMSPSSCSFLRDILYS